MAARPPPPPPAVSGAIKPMRKPSRLDGVHSDASATACRASAPVDTPLPLSWWQGVTQTLRTSSGSVFIAHHGARNERLIIKSGPSIGREYFALRFARELLHVNAPAVRLISFETDDEWSTIKHVFASVSSEADARLAEKALTRPQYLALEYVPGASLDGMAPTDRLRQRLFMRQATVENLPLPAKTFASLGSIALLDLVLNNADRMPCGVWDNAGNFGNVLFRASDGVAFAIDPTVVSIADAAAAERHFSRVQALLDELVRHPAGPCPGIGSAMRALADAAGVPAIDRECEAQFVAGMRSTLAAAAALADAAVHELHSSVSRAVRTDWQNVWRDAMASFTPDFICHTLSCMRRACAAAASAGAAWAVPRPARDVALATLAEQVRRAAPLSIAQMSARALRGMAGLGETHVPDAREPDSEGESDDDGDGGLLHVCEGDGVRIACLQWRSMFIEQALVALDAALSVLLLQGRPPDLVVLPEGWMSLRRDDSLAGACAFATELGVLAARYRVAIVPGTFTETVAGAGPSEPAAFFCTALAIDDSGDVVAAYRKQRPVLDGGMLTAGRDTTVCTVHFGVLALLICYDIENESVLADTLAWRPRVLANPVHIPARHEAADARLSRWRIGTATVARALQAKTAHQARCTIARADVPVDAGGGLGSSQIIGLNSTVAAPRDRVTSLVFFDDNEPLPFAPECEPRSERRDEDGVRALLTVLGGEPGRARVTCLASRQVGAASRPLLFAGHADGVLEAWDAALGTSAFALAAPGECGVAALGCVLDQAYLASLSRDGCVRLYDVSLGSQGASGAEPLLQAAARPASDGRRAGALAGRADGVLLAGASHTSLFCVDPRVREPVRLLAGATEAADLATGVRALAWLDEARLAVSTRDGRVVLIDMRAPDGAVLATHACGMRAAGALLAAEGGGLWLADTHSGALSFAAVVGASEWGPSATRHDRGAATVALLAAPGVAVRVRRDGAAELWRAPGVRARGTLRVCSSPCTAAVTHDGALVAGCADGSISVCVVRANAKPVPFVRACEQARW